jgi:two-component system, OmpR family, osmolarity sensor histidine kinase EnvZ
MSLFWRQFLWLAGLIAAAMFTWLGMAHVLERGPRSQDIAWQILSAINFTRSAVVSADPLRRPTLLQELARDEGVRISIAEPSDVLLPLPDTPDIRALRERLLQTSKENILLASSINGESGFWVSFDILGDAYWLGFDSRRFQTRAPFSLLPWAAGVVLLAVMGAAYLTRRITQPLQALRFAMGRVLRGEPATDLPTDRGSQEFRALNKRFNFMQSELLRVESDRALALAGVSHDIRTPLTRLRMELELCELSEEQKLSMVEEIERIDQLIGQFVEYSRAGENKSVSRIDLKPWLDALLASLLGPKSQDGAGGMVDVEWTIEVTPDLTWLGNELDLERMLSNLILNASKYGRSAKHLGAVAKLQLSISIRPRLNDPHSQVSDGIFVLVADHGPGVPAESLNALLRPFARLDSERAIQAGGSGLGLAIVARLARQYQGQVKLRNKIAPETGLVVELTLKDRPQTQAEEA